MRFSKNIDIFAKSRAPTGQARWGQTATSAKVLRYVEFTIIMLPT